MCLTVTGVDPAAESVATARTHAAAAGLDIDDQIGNGEALPFAADTFDAVACCDVLEHVEDPSLVIAELARVLKPNGVLLYDTINLTFTELGKKLAFRESDDLSASSMGFAVKTAERRS